MSTTTRSPWVVPLTAVALGAVMFAGLAVNGDPVAGACAAAIMAVYAAVLAVGGRSQFLRLLRGEHDDERMAAVDVRALAATGGVMVCAVVLGALQAVLRGADPDPWMLLCALGGVTYAGSLALLSWRG